MIIKEVEFNAVNAFKKEQLKSYIGRKCYLYTRSVYFGDRKCYSKNKVKILQMSNPDKSKDPRRAKVTFKFIDSDRIECYTISPRGTFNANSLDCKETMYFSS